ncbi:MAG TPA: hypothetical protein DDW52_29285 [Planctomycetaceae bacterium]|nr:hypothetical protein [Planctomycetaceae bacterium]
MKIATRLYRRGQITAEQLAESLCVAAKRRKPIGQIALERRVLTIRQAMEVLAFQSEHSNVQFGQAAVRLGYLTEAEVTSLLGIQEEEVPTLSAILVELGYVSTQTLAEEISVQRELAHAVV